MKWYVQVIRAESDGKWHQVNMRYNENHAIQDATHTYANRDNMASKGVLAVRVVKGKRNPVVVFERILS